MHKQSGKRSSRKGKMKVPRSRFRAQAEYAESLFRSCLGDMEASISALRRALELDPGYAPVVLSLGSVEYQLRRGDRGKKLFLSLVSLPPSAADEGESDLTKIIDEAGDFLISIGNCADGLELYRAAVKRFPDLAVLRQGLGFCAAYEGLLEESIAAYEAAVELDPENQKYVNDLGRSLFEAGRLEEARRVLTRAVAMDPTDELARENLRVCIEASSVKGV